MKKSLLFATILSVTFGACAQQTTERPVTNISTPEWSTDATIYEVNIRQFSKEGTFAAFQKELPRLKAMGVEILWLMPIHPIGMKNRKGSLGSYYAVRDYKAVNPEYGTKDDFKNLVNAVHQLGMKIIIDWVPNHTSPDAVWVDQGHKDWYTLDSTGNLQPTIGTDWWDVADLNYDSKEMRSAMIGSMKYWLTDFDIDGFRCDVADWVPVDFWKEARVELDKVKNVFMLAEAENPAHHQVCFNMSYGWEFHSIMNKIAKGEKSAADIFTYFEKENKNFPANAYRMQFTSNHDENSWNGTEMERMGEGRFAFAVLAGTINGMPLVYNGQETSLDKRLRFFEKDTIDWTKMDMVDFYTKLLGLHKTNPALWNGAAGGDLTFLTTPENKEFIAYTRTNGENQVVVFINLSNKGQIFTYNSAKICGKYTNLFSGKKGKLKNKGTMELPAWGYQVYSK